LPALVALVSNGFVTALIVVAVVVAVNQLGGDIPAPVVLGQALSLYPLVIQLALSAGTIVAGIIGALLAVPFAAVAWTVVKTFREPRAGSRVTLKANRPLPPDAARGCPRPRQETGGDCLRSRTQTSGS
jgi:predicted PurR-regulated permease PerM